MLEQSLAGKTIICVAGGTGGHIFPAESLAHALLQLGANVCLITDSRGAQFAKKFPGIVHVVPSAPWVKSPQGLLKLAQSLAQGVWQTFKLYRALKPNCVIGFGGYPTVPPLGLAQLMGINTIIHEQNAVLGRANSLLAMRAKTIALGLPVEPNTLGINGVKAQLVGTPVRGAVMAQVGKPYPERDEFMPLKMVVFGGSQGARVFADVLPPACGLLTFEERALLSITHQVRTEDYDRVNMQYAAMNVKVQLAPFFADLPERIADAHLVIGRAGASTVAELAALGRPSILVPLPNAVDQDQANNAKTLQNYEAAIVVPQVQFTPEALAIFLRQAIANPDRLKIMAEAARGQARLDATQRLVNIILGQIV